MDKEARTARLAGVLYLLVVLTGVFVILHVPARLYVRGDSAATAANILSHQALFRLHILVGFVSEFLFIALVLVLYRLLQDVDRLHAALMVMLVLLPAPLALFGQANLVATLAFLQGNGFSAFDKPQRDALAMLLLDADQAGSVVMQLFWGLWLLPLGRLVFRSGFLPRVLGAWLIVNGLAYVGIGLTGLLSPDHAATVGRFATPALLGEVAFLLWLLAVGVRPQSPARSRANP